MDKTTLPAVMKMEYLINGECTIPEKLDRFFKLLIGGGGQLDGWKWDCCRLMLLDVSMCLVVLFSDFGINTIPKIWKTCSRPTTSYNTCRRPFSSSSARRRRTTTVPQLPLSSIRKKNSATTVRNRLHNAGLYARRPAVCVPPTDDSEGTAYAGQANMFLGRSNNGLLCCSQTSPDLQWRVIQGVY
ncbi:HTH_Tnp_Tc3_2 domain-containing protein [Trichonephila clavipes]|nr:HTH_Tnp_Tc3_2 domain-containing protein [Trichonephila clavipes]